MFTPQHHNVIHPDHPATISEVFAFNVNQASMVPPFMGWRFPLRGPLDNSLRVQLGLAAPETTLDFLKPTEWHFRGRDSVK